MVKVFQLKKIPHTGILLAAVNQVNGSGSALRVLPGSGSAKKKRKKGCGSATLGRRTSYRVDC